MTDTTSPAEHTTRYRHSHSADVLAATVPAAVVPPCAFVTLGHLLTTEMEALVTMAEALPRHLVAEFVEWAHEVVAHESAALAIRREIATRPAARDEAERIAARGLALWERDHERHRRALTETLAVFAEVA